MIRQSGFGACLVRRAFSTILLLLCLGLCYVNAQVTEATILGTVTDSTGAAVPNATVEAKNTATGLSRSLASDTQGRYNLNNLPIGNYDVSASVAGFETLVRKGVTLTVGAQVVVDFALTVGQQQQTVTVEAQVSQVDTTSSAVTSLVDQRQIRELPLNGRNIEQLILLAPGVQQFTTMSTNSFFGRNATYSVAGGRPEGQAFLLDNQDLQNFYGKGIGASGVGTSLGVDGIAEFQTLTNTYGAQFGGSGAAINSVSKSGTNQFHGSAFEFLRNSAMDARNFFDGSSVPPFRRNQFGGSIGGPIKKDKLFFFVNDEGLKQNLTLTKVAQTPDLNNRTISPSVTDPVVRKYIQDTLALYPAPDFPSFFGQGIGKALTTGAQVASENYLLARGDYTLSDKDTVFLRFLNDRASYFDPYPFSAIPVWHEQTLNRNYFATLEERRIISPTIVNSARVSFSRPGTSGETLTSAPGTHYFPLSGSTYIPFTDRQDGNVAIPGLSSLGPNSTTPFVMNVSKYIIGDDVFWTKGAHSLKFGMSVLYNQTNAQNNFSGGLSWTFGNYASFLSGTATLVTGVFPNSIVPGEYFNRDTRSTEYTPYFDDQWKVSSKLTLNLGIRYTFQTNPTERHNQLYGFANPPFFAPPGTPGVFSLPGFSVGIPHLSNVWVNGNPSKFNFDPRVGFAYDPFADHKTSIRGGFGIFHNVIEARTYMPGTWNDPPQIFGQQLNPSYGQAFTSVSPAPIRMSPGLDPNINTTPYAVQWNMNVQHDFSGNVLTVGYVGSSGVHLVNEDDLNPPIPQTINGVQTFSSVQVVNGKPTIVPFPRINPLAGQLLLNQVRGHSKYEALQVSMNRRLSRGLQSQVSYTWSHCQDNGSVSTGQEGSNSGGAGYQNPYNQSAEAGNCAFDVRQTLRVNAVYALPFHGNQLVSGWQISGIFTATAGLPLTVTEFDHIGATDPARPNVVVGCNGGQQIIGTVAKWMNSACYSFPGVGIPGNAGRTNLYGPGLTNFDVSLVKDTRIPKISETFSIQFRAEFFDILNHPNFNVPASSVFTQGACTVATNTCAIGINPAFGTITSTLPNASRQIQLGLRLLF